MFNLPKLYSLKPRNNGSEKYYLEEENEALAFLPSCVKSTSYEEQNSSFFPKRIGRNEYHQTIR